MIYPHVFSIHLTRSPAVNPLLPWLLHVRALTMCIEFTFKNVTLLIPPSPPRISGLSQNDDIMSFGRLADVQRSPRGQFREDLELSDLAKKIKALSTDSDDDADDRGQSSGPRSRSSQVLGQASCGVLPVAVVV